MNNDPYPNQQPPSGPYPSNPGYPPQGQPGPYTQYPPQQPGYPPSGYPQGQPPMQPQQPGYPMQPQQPGYPPSGYPMQPPMQPQQPAPKKKNKLAIGCGSLIALVIFIVIISAVSNGGKNSASNTSATSSSSSPNNSAQQQAPSQPQTWQTTHTYSGSGIKKTETITVADDWKIQWSCTPSSFMGNQYNIIITVYGSDGTMQDVAINDMCKDGNTSGETEEHTGGNVYLDVNSEGQWSITIQELK